MLTLLVGLGLLSIERVFPMIIGSNIGILLILRMTLIRVRIISALIQFKV